MPHEPVSNIGWTCPEHSNQPRIAELYGKRLLKSFLGKYVKLSFPVIPCPADAPEEIQEIWPHKDGREAMWVLVVDIKNGQLIGVVKNDPYFALDYPCESKIAFSRDEICHIEGEPDPRGEPKRH